MEYENITQIKFGDVCRSQNAANLKSVYATLFFVNCGLLYQFTFNFPYTTNNNLAFAKKSVIRTKN